MNTTDAPTVQAMSEMGGCFVRSLAQTARNADPENYDRLRQAFPDIWSRYSKMAALKTMQSEDQFTCTH